MTPTPASCRPPPALPLRLPHPLRLPLRLTPPLPTQNQHSRFRPCSPRLRLSQIAPPRGAFWGSYWRAWAHPRVRGGS
ncbi:unnamed protein product [Closterium sp. NIES-54]